MLKSSSKDFEKMDQEVKAFYYENGMDKRIMSVQQQKNVLNTYEETKERINPMVQIKVNTILQVFP